MKTRIIFGCLALFSLSTSLLAQYYSSGPVMYPGIWNSIVYYENKTSDKLLDTTYRYVRVFEDSTYQLVLYHANKDYSKEKIAYYEYGYLDANPYDWTLVKLYHREAPDTECHLSSEKWFNVSFGSDSRLLITRDGDTEEVMDWQLGFSEFSPDSIYTFREALKWHKQRGLTDSIDSALVFNHWIIDSTWAMEVVPLLYDYPYYSENYFRDWDFPKLEYYLLSTLPPKRTKVLDGTSFSLELDPGDSLETLKTIYLGGDFLGKSGSKLLFNTSFVSKRKETDPKLGNDIEFSQENNVRYADYRYNPHILKVDANKIISLQCNSQSREKIFNTGIVISTLSAITTLVIAPLVSMNYKTGKINSATYLTVAGIGLAGWTVNIPLMTIFRSKVYNLSYNSPDSYMYDDNWRIYKRFKNKKDRTD